jgi:hydrogenase maturation protease
MRADVLVLGIGNELFTDEGLGPVAARHLAALDLPGVDVLDGATLGLSLLPEVAGRRALLVLDAIAAGTAAPGDVLVLDGAEVTRPTTRLLSAHQVGIGETLAVAEFAGELPSLVTAVGLVPACLDTGYGLSPLGRQRLPAVLDVALAVLAAWGVDMQGHATNAF